VLAPLVMLVVALAHYGACRPRIARRS
jgi:hypothetical protein